MIKLKPCPFCGGKAEYYGGLNELVGCDNCSAFAHSEDWNRRVKK